jgi:hypothetical protein
MTKTKIKLSVKNSKKIAIYLWLASILFPSPSSLVLEPQNKNKILLSALYAQLNKDFPRFIHERVGMRGLARHLKIFCDIIEWGLDSGQQRSEKDKKKFETYYIISIDPNKIKTVQKNEHEDSKNIEKGKETKSHDDAIFSYFITNLKNKIAERNLDTFSEKGFFHLFEKNLEMNRASLALIICQEFEKLEKLEKKDDK